MPNKFTMPLADAALRMGVTYQRARNMLFAHRIEGVRVDDRFWFVDPLSVERYLAKRNGEADEPPPRRNRQRSRATA